VDFWATIDGTIDGTKRGTGGNAWSLIEIEVIGISW
jgi:hypothetical protein